MGCLCRNELAPASFAWHFVPRALDRSRVDRVGLDGPLCRGSLVGRGMGLPYRGGVEGIAHALSGLETRDHAWRFIRDFAAAWTTPISDVDGCTDEMLYAAEARLGVRLPAAVREGYGLFGQRKDLTSSHGSLWSPNDLRHDRNHAILVFRATHQDVAHLGVSLTDENGDDPPTYIHASYLHQRQESWEPFIDRFSLACVEIVLWEMVEAGPHSDARDETERDADALFAGLIEVPFPRYPSGFETRWYVNDDIILRHYPGWVAVAARTDEGLDTFRQAHSGTWVNA
jgi:hypothetical protein